MSANGSVCVVVADDHGARCASHCFRAAGWGGVHFEANPAASVRLVSGGKPVVLNVARCTDDEVTEVLDNLNRLGLGRDWRTPPPDLTEEEWKVLYALADEPTVDDVAAKVHLSARTAARRIASAREKFGVETQAELLVAFSKWRLPQPA